MLNKYKKIIFDVILNVCATALPLAVLQIIVLPYIARYLGDEANGKMLTVISLLTVVSGSLGNSLNNIRLIKNNNYERKAVEGDFKFLIIIEMLVSSFSVCLIASQYHISLIEQILLFILAALWTYREYAIVAFRIKLNFMGIVFNNIIMVIGYVIGLLIFRFTKQWEFIYIIGICFSILFVLNKSNIGNESLKKTIFFVDTFKDLIILIIASLLLNVLNYADRMLIYPMLGGTAVSIYYASTLFGKIVSSAVSPLNAVVLSYISKKETMNKKIMYKIIGSTTAIAIIGYVFCRIIARPALKLMYPEWAYDSMRYVPIMTVVAMITMMSSVLTPFIMKFCNMKWQLVINGSVLVVYLVFSITLYTLYGLMGFCIGVLISNIVKLIIMIFLGIRVTGIQKEVTND